MRMFTIIAAVFAAKAFTTAITYPAGDGDIAWQRFLGHWILTHHRLPTTLGNDVFSAPGAPWVPQEWLFSMLAALATGSAWPFFAGSIALCSVTTLYFIALRAHHRGASELGIILGTGLAGIALDEAFGVRAQCAVWPLLAIYLYLLERPGRRFWMAFPIVIIWGWIHASVLLAPAIATIGTLGSYIDSRWNSETKRMTVMTMLSAGATIMNPLGITLPVYTFTLLHGTFKSMINEWSPTSIEHASYLLGALPLLLIYAIGNKRPKKAYDGFIFAATFVLMLTAIRNIAIFAITNAAVAASMVEMPLRYRLMPSKPPSAKAAKAMAVMTPLFALIIFSSSVATVFLDKSRTAVSYPKDAIAAIERLPGNHNILCLDFAWCSHFLTTGKDRIYLDGRADPFPNSVWDRYERIIRVKSTWQNDLTQSGADLLLVNRDSRLESVLVLTNGWSVVYNDKKYRVWRRENG